MTDPVVFPNSFVDGITGREVIAGYNGEPRIKCLSGGLFQIGAGSTAATIFTVSTTVDTFSAFGGVSPRPVQADGFNIVGWTPPPVILPSGSAWPPSWWPSIQTGNDQFQTGIPTVNPPWAIGGGGPQPPPWNGSDDEQTYLEACQTYLTGQGVESSNAESMCQAAWDESQLTRGAPTPAAASLSEPQRPRPRRKR